MMILYLPHQKCATRLACGIITRSVMPTVGITLRVMTRHARYVAYFHGMGEATIHHAKRDAHNPAKCCRWTGAMYGSITNGKRVIDKRRQRGFTGGVAARITRVIQTA